MSFGARRAGEDTRQNEGYLHGVVVVGRREGTPEWELSCLGQPQSQIAGQAPGRVDGHRLEFLDTVICANYAGAYQSVVPNMETVQVHPSHMLHQQDFDGILEVA